MIEKEDLKTELDTSSMVVVQEADGIPLTSLTLSSDKTLESAPDSTGVDNPAFSEEGVVDLEADAEIPSPEPPAVVVESAGEAPVEVPGEASEDAPGEVAEVVTEEVVVEPPMNGTATEIPEEGLTEPVPAKVDGNENSKPAEPSVDVAYTTDEQDGSPPIIDVKSEQVNTATSMTSGRIRVTPENTSPYDTVVPAEATWVTDRNRAVRLRMGAEGLAADPPVSVPSLLIDTANKVPNHIALVAKETATSPPTIWTYRDYLRDAKTVAKGFIKLGLEPMKGVGILGFNAPQWSLSLLGAIFAGGLGTGIYTTNSAEAVHYVLDHCDANIVVVEDAAQLAKVLEVRDRLPNLKAIIQYRGIFPVREEGCHTWSELLNKGKEVSDEELDERLRLAAPNKCCSLIYTSGTTGKPKGVMLSHDNVTWTSKAVVLHCRFRWTKEVTISFLPLSHIAAQLSDIFVAIAAASTVHFAQPDALKGSLIHTLQEVRPTAFLAVPRVWEKLAERMRELAKETKGCKRKIGAWAKGVGLKNNLAIMNKQRPSIKMKVAKVLVFRKVKARLGLDRCNSFFSGAAPISKDILEYFMSLDMPITEIYGMSESTGPQHVGVAWDYKIGTVGPVMPGVETRLLDKDKDGNGEICFLGRHVFMGYLDNDEKTLEAIDSEGLLHSGDIGKFDQTGNYLSITGRIKELLITAGGENVAPVPIEDNVKHELPVVSNAMLIGDKRKFLSILLTLKTVVDPDTLIPSDQLTPAAIDWVKSVGSSATRVSDILHHTDVPVMRGIQAGIDRANKHAVSRAQKVQKWSILPIDFSIPGGELGPSLKLKRPVAAKIYAKTIESFYQGT